MCSFEPIPPFHAKHTPPHSLSGGPLIPLPTPTSSLMNQDGCKRQGEFAKIECLVVMGKAKVDVMQFGAFTCVRSMVWAL